MRLALIALILSLPFAVAHEHQHFVVANQPDEAAPEGGAIPVLDTKGEVYKTEGPNDFEIYGTTIGEKKLVMVYTHFPDTGVPRETSREIKKKMFGDGRFQNIFHQQSYGKLKLTVSHIHGWREMPRPKEQNDPTTTEGHRQMFVDIFALYPEINFFDYDYIVAKLPGRGNFAFGERQDKAIPYRDGFIFHAVNIGSNHPGVLAHELAHCMGLPDIYTYGELKPKNPAGPWDIMSNASGAAGFLGWHRHKLGWMDADRQRYLTRGTHQMELTPLDAKSGSSMIVVPTDDPKHPSKVYVIEIGQPPIPKKDEMPFPAGVLIYSVDATLATGKNPVVVHGREGLGKDATYLTGHSFEAADAPLKVDVGEALEHGGFNVKITITPLP
ncbi:MAG: hypothetical protein R3242_09595 [Akkermansiaceae bacterium]|nr:hypothetical protein [Akkermansiaceae bacterium]